MAGRAAKPASGRSAKAAGSKAGAPKRARRSGGRGAGDGRDGSGDRRAFIREAAASGAKPSSLEELLAAKEIVISCGSGGVGKTTTAAALAAMAAAYHGGKVLVLTVDPARRLANALGLEEFGNVEVRVPAKAFTAAGVEPRGELYAAMLDTKQSWDDLIRRHAPDAKTRDALLANPLYNNVTGKFVQSHDYIAMERLYEIHASGTYDLIVVDTPPTRNAIDFLEAPDRMAELFTGRLLRWLLAPYQSRVFSAASRPFYKVADRVLGAQVLEDLAEFFMLLTTMSDGFIERARSVSRTLADKRTTFIVVSTLESAPVQEAEFFIEALHDRNFQLGAVVLNKVLPDYLRDPGGSTVARRLADDHEAVAGTLLDAHGELAELGTQADIGRVLREVGESFLNYSVVAKREAEQRAELGRIPEVVASVPYFDADIIDLGGLLQLGNAVWE
ncbi:MAG TPA: ArsA-related P-loop ATPase [Acidimicrobiales bacterium]|jgi:anion-transporting  ArsA/GET3 family ATPase|nr:ArsA-related P-loop ATPase [Acidimicrobiales bacterium]